MTDPETSADLDGHCCDGDDVTDVLGRFFATAIATWASDNAFGAFRPTPTTVEGKLGQALGDTAAQYTGASEVEGGTAGLASAPETAMVPEVGPEGAALQAVGSEALILHGTATVTIATVNLAKSAIAPDSRPGKDFTPAGKREIDARDGNKCQNCGRDVKSEQNKKGQSPSPDQRHRHHIKPKKDGGSGTPENGKTLCLGCHKEEHKKINEQQ